MQTLFKNLGQMKYGHILSTSIRLAKSIDVLKKHDSSILASTLLQCEINERIDLFFYMSNRLLK